MSELYSRPVSRLPVGTGLSRFISAVALSDGSTTQARAIAEKWIDTPQVEHAFELRTKAAMTAGSTTDATWAAPLSQAGIADEALQLLRTLSVVGALEGKTIKAPFNHAVPADVTSAVLGDWVVEGTPTPVGALTFNAVALPPSKIATIVALTRELFRVGIPSAEAVVRNAVLQALAKTIDTKFLLPTLAAAPGKPASITNGATVIVSTGATAAAIATDLGAMLAAITTSAAGLTWIMKPTTAAHVAAALGSASDLPRTLYALPVILSANSPAQITLVDAAAILLADDGQFDVSISESATVQMNSAPDSPPLAASVLTSFFQQNLIGVRAVRWIGWKRAVDGSVVYMTVGY